MLTKDHVILLTAILYGRARECDCGDDYASSKRHDSHDWEHVLLRNFGHIRRNSKSRHNILGHVVPGYVYLSHVRLTHLVIGVVGADMSNCVGNMFATSNVSKEFQSIAVAIVVTMLSLSQTIGQSVSSALITSNLPHDIANLDIGGNGLSGNVPLDQLVKGFHAAFWFGLGCACTAAAISMTLRIGTRGHKGEKDLRNIATVTAAQRDTSAVSTGNDFEAETIQRTLSTST
jgi:hypothetical protein